MPLDTNLQKIQRLLSVLDEDNLTKTDFIKAFENVVNFVVKIQKSQSEAIQRLEETYKILINKLQSDHAGSLSDLKRGVNELFVAGKLKEMDSKTRLEFNS